MKKLKISLVVVTIAIIGVIILKFSPGFSDVLWKMSEGGKWLLPLVVFSAILDSVHPCSFSILLITIAFLFGIQTSRKKILQIGGTYIAGIFASYFLIGLGILKVLHIFNTPHFMGKLGASILIIFGMLNLLNRFFPSFPIKLKIPTFAHKAMGGLLEKATFPAAFGLGLLVGLCQFPCMGGPYLMVIGLLRDQVTYMSGFGHLLLYNLILALPLVAVLWVSANNALLGKMQEWKNNNMNGLKLWAGIVMIIIGVLIFFI